MQFTLQVGNRFCVMAILLTLVLFIQACGKKDKSDLDSSLKRYDKYLLNLDADSLAGIFAENGELGQEGMPSITGRETIRNYMKSFSGITIFENSSESKSIDFSGDSAVQKGIYSQRLAFNSDTVAVNGEFNAVWVKDKENAWLLRKMITKPLPGN